MSFFKREAAEILVKFIHCQVAILLLLDNAFLFRTRSVFVKCFDLFHLGIYTWALK